MKMWVAKSEDWVVCEDYPSYMINREGQVKSNLTNKILKPARLKTGYMYVGLEKREYIPAWSLHRLIEIAQLPQSWQCLSGNWYNEIIAHIQSMIHINQFNKEYLKK